MISETIRNAVVSLRGRLESGHLSAATFDQACTVLLDAAQQVEQIEATAVPEARRRLNDPAVVDFVEARQRRSANEYLRSQGLRPLGPDGAA